MRYRHILRVLLLFATLPLVAQAPLATGDVIVVTGRCVIGACADEVLAPRFEIHVLPAADLSLRTVHSDFTSPPGPASRITPTAIHAFAPDRIYFVSGAVGGNRKEVLLSTNFQNAFTIANVRGDIAQLVPMASGHLLVLQGNGELVEIDGGGHVVATHSQSLRSTRAVTLGLDQCRLFYVPSLAAPLGERLIARFNICTKRAEPDFATMSSPVSAIRVLPSGDVLVAAHDDVYRLNPAGEVVERYGLSYISALSLTPDGRAFWAAGGALDLVRVSLTDPSAAPLTYRLREDVVNVAVVGEWRPPVPMRRRSARR